MVRLISLALLAALAAATARAAPPRLAIPFERYQLPNGLTVILHEDHRLPIVTVDIWYHVGSQDEKKGRTGFAHLFEHLMFMGTKAVPNGEFDSIMESWGGSNNATTSEDRTTYHETGPANLLETFLWLEADRLATLPGAMTRRKVDLQRDVVKNERRQSYENRPYGRVDLVLPGKLYPPDHPYHHPVIGSHQDLSAASVADVKTFFRDYYVAANAALVVTGDFEPAHARALIARYFGPLARRPVPRHAAPAPARLARAERVVLEDAVQLERVTLAWHAPAAFAPGDAECELLAAVLSTGKSSRLYRALVYERKLAQEVRVDHAPSQHGGVLTVTATAQPGHGVAELEQAIDAELRALTRSPPTAEELARARAHVETSHLRLLEQPVGLADTLAFYEFYFRDPGQLEKRLLARYEDVTPEGLARETEKVLAQPRLTVAVVPGKGGM